MAADPSPPGAEAPDTVMAGLGAVEPLLAAGDLAAAQARLDALGRDHPRDPRVPLMRVYAAEAAGDAAGAERQARRAVALAPDWEVPVVELALLLARQRRYAEAVEAAEHAVTLAPHNLDMLVRAVQVAQQALNPQRALDWLDLAMRQAPDHPEIALMRARNLTQLDRHGEALALYAGLLAEHPDAHDLRFVRAKAAWHAGDATLAQDDLRQLCAHDPSHDTWRFWAELVAGRVPPTQPAGMTRTMFDGYAAVFEQHLEQGLQYRVPARVAEALRGHHPDGRFDLLDLGCGTGLLARHLGTARGRRVGVDLSPRMLDEARAQGLYTELVEAGLHEHLAADTARYDAIAACDVFIYAGDLAPVLPQVAARLKPGGRFIVSCESAGDGEPDLVLRPSLRYAHKPAHVQALCEAAGLTGFRLEPVTIRVENDRPIPGFIATAQHPL